MRGIWENGGKALDDLRWSTLGYQYDWTVRSYEAERFDVPQVPISLVLVLLGDCYAKLSAFDSQADAEFRADPRSRPPVEHLASGVHRMLLRSEVVGRAVGGAGDPSDCRGGNGGGGVQ